MATIRSLEAYEILDSRGNPTLEVRCTLVSGISAVASVPSGASTGVHEAVELRDGGTRYGGLGVEKAARNVANIAAAVTHSEHTQASLDEAIRGLDGTQNKSHLGANAMLGVSLSFARACALESQIPLYAYLGACGGNATYSLPQPMFNVINGGKHADSGLDVQEYLLAPVGFTRFAEKVEAAAAIIAVLRRDLHAQGYSISVGDEGGFAPKLPSNEAALEWIERAIGAAGYSYAQVKIGLDVAASSFYKDGHYVLRDGDKSMSLDRTGLLAWYESLLDKHPLISIEDPFAEDDWEGFTELVTRVGEKVSIVGDDLTVTNVERIRTAANKRAITSVLIKPNQIGTLSETIAAIQVTREQGWSPFVSHRSGETTDTFIADLAVGLACPYIKAGSLARGERVAKYNRLMEIERELIQK